MTVNHDAVGSSPTGGANKKRSQKRPFLLAFLLLPLHHQPCGYKSPSPTELSEVGGKASETPPVADEVRMAWRSGQFFVSVSEQEKLGTTRGSVTVNHDAVDLRGQGEPEKSTLRRAFLTKCA